jgi:D-alanyl-D-alanine carboxypeptidase
MISTANDLNTFIRGFVSGKLFNPQVLTDPAGFVPGAGGPPGPGTNSSGLSIYRYETACGTVFGHTGNMPGYTAFVGSTSDGSNSVVVVVNSQITPKGNDAVFNRLLAVENQAICSANGQTGPSASASG